LTSQKPSLFTSPLLYIYICAILSFYITDVTVTSTFAFGELEN